MRTTVIACGALTLHLKEIAKRRGWDIDLQSLPPELHNRPEQIAEAVAVRAEGHERVVVAYAGCGTGEVLNGFARLEGAHCYDLFAREVVREALAEQPGTYFLTDFLVRSFDRVVVRGLGLDRYPELRDEYFRNYTRVIWLAQRPTDALQRSAERAAAFLGLELEVFLTGDHGLEDSMSLLLGGDHQC